MLIRSLDEKDLETEQFETISGEKMTKIFSLDAEGHAMCWSKFKNKDAIQWGKRCSLLYKAIGGNKTNDTKAINDW